MLGNGLKRNKNLSKQICAFYPCIGGYKAAEPYGRRPIQADLPQLLQPGYKRSQIPSQLHCKYHFVFFVKNTKIQLYLTKKFKFCLTISTPKKYGNLILVFLEQEIETNKILVLNNIE